MSKPEESKEFADAIFGGGTYSSVVCDFCGRTHFCDDSYGVWEDGDDKAFYKQLEALSVKEPDKYIICDYTIRHGVFDGKTAIEGCPCGMLKTYEDFIWNHKYQIMEYLVARYKNQKNAVARFGERIQDVVSEEQE